MFNTTEVAEFVTTSAHVALIEEIVAALAAVPAFRSTLIERTDVILDEASHFWAQVPFDSCPEWKLGSVAFTARALAAASAA